MKLLDQVRHTARVKHFSYRTEQAYSYWVERFIRFHGIRHPNTMGTAQVEQFLTHLAVAGKVAASTQNQALGALLTALTCRAGCKECGASKSRYAGPVKRNALLSRNPAVFVQPFPVGMAVTPVRS